MQQLTLALTANEMHIRRSYRAKNLRISINPVGNIEVVVPARVSVSDAQRFIQEQQSWIIHKKQQIDSLRSEELNEALPTVIYLPAINEKWQVEYRGGPPELKFENNDVTNINTLRLTIENDKQAGELLKRWLSKKARNVLLPWLQVVSRETGLKYSSASIRGQRTRWASCSSRRNISLNRCLLFLKPEQVQYLLVHELCHTREMNHSKKFWQLVSQFIPDYLQQEKVVNEHCYKLPRWAY